MTQDHIDYILELLTSFFFLKVVSTVDVWPNPDSDTEYDMLLED